MIALLSFVIQRYALLPKAQAPEDVGEHCLATSDQGCSPVQGLTSSSSTTLHEPAECTHTSNPAFCRNGTRHTEDLADQAPEDWTHLRDVAVYEITRTLQKLVHVAEAEIAGEIAFV